MKKLIFLLIASGGALSALAQAPSTENTSKKKFAPDSLLSRWVVDINLLGGGVMQDLTVANTLNNYNNSIAGVSNIGKLSFNNGYAYGFDAQLGYFFGKKNNFGIGTGFMFMHQYGEVSMNNFHVEYQATDSRNQVFRQVVSTNGKATEKLEMTNMNIPLLLKYKHRFSKRIGFTADLGALFNLQMKNEYKTNASFNYEAIYQTVGTGDNITTVYDNGTTPSANDIFYTKAEYTRLNPGPNVNTYVNNYFNTTLRNAGYNVGLGIHPDNNSGSVSYAVGSVGFLIQPSINYYLSDNVALNFGGYYLYQPFTNTASKTYQLTDKVGSYGSVMNTVTAANNQSYGLNIGVRFYIGKGLDSDHDGIPNKDDRCPYTFGVEVFHGCPDSDGDAIPDIDDACPRVPGLAKFNGCPDSDGDGIPDKDDACPYAPGPVANHGCPDRDGDGILDKDDVCPDKPGLAQFKGCPDTDGDGIPDNEDHCPDQAGPAENHGCPLPPPAPKVEEIKVTTPILFELNKTVIQVSSYPVLEVAAKKLDADKESYVIVDGYTDITGKPAYNKALSLRRAKAVKKRLIEMGVSAKRIKIVGHGAKSPAASNDTEEGRMQNRRAVMHLSVGE
jgi:outer membrane protein OmpA-like peptidoglycan-associated protein